MEKIIQKLQSFEPVGVFARTVKECLLLQIARQPEQDADLILLVSDYLNDIAENKIPKICMNTGFDREHVLTLISRIKQLKPLPGNEFWQWIRKSIPIS